MSMTFKFDLYNGVLIVLTVILIVVIALKCTVKSCDCKEKENDEFNVKVEGYENMNKYLNHLKKHRDIGTPSGLLSALPEQDSCDPTGSGRNLIVQNKVTFKPTRFKTGCTYIDMQYPGAL